MASVVRVGSSSVTSPLAGGITNGNITAATARPYKLSTMDVDTALTMKAINRKLQIESTLDEVFLDIGAEVVFTGQKVSIPDSVVMKVTSEKGARYQVMPMMNPLAGPGVAGWTNRSKQPR